MNEEKKHLFISIVLGAAVVLVAVGAVIAIRMSFEKNRLPLPSGSQISSDPAGSRETISSDPVSSREASSSQEPASSRESSSPPLSSQEASSVQESSAPPPSSEESSPEEASAPSDFVDDSGATAVTLFANGQTQALTPEEITAFMQLYLRVNIAYVRSEDNSELNAASNGGFTIAYQDGRQESYHIGEPYDGTWWSGNDFYEVDRNAMSLEEYMCSFPLIAGWVGRQLPETAPASPEGSE